MTLVKDMQKNIAVHYVLKYVRSLWKSFVRAIPLMIHLFVMVCVYMLIMHTDWNAGRDQFGEVVKASTEQIIQRTEPSNL